MRTLCCGLLFTVCCLGVSRIFGQGVLIYDQQSSDENNLGGGIANIQSLQPMGQSFIPTYSSVGFIRIYPTDTAFNNVGATIYLNLRAGSISGTVVAATSPVVLPDEFHGTTDFFSSPPYQ
jgi:hypothetical protein